MALKYAVSNKVLPECPSLLPDVKAFAAATWGASFNTVFREGMALSEK